MIHVLLVDDRAVVLLDLDLGPGPDGVEITRSIRAHQKPPQVLIFTTFDADADSVRTIEAGIITLLGEGLSNRDLSHRLLISEATVKTHLAHVYKKLGATSRGSAVAIAAQRGLIRGRSTPTDPGSTP